MSSLLPRRLSSFFQAEAPLEGGDRLLVAFSGGPDSTALLAGLERLSRELGVALHAGHLDHALDAGSRRRAEAARELARRLSVPIVVERLEPGLRPRGSSLEAYAREQRYRFLDRLARSLDARYVATAHHADDQAETLLLRLAFGSGLAGLAGIRSRCGRLVRPLLTLRRRELRESLAELAPPGAALEPVDDATNRDLSRPRNFLRHRLLGTLEAEVPDLVARLGRLAELAAAAGARVERRLEERLALRREAGGVPAADRASLSRLSPELLAAAAALLHRRAGLAYPPAASALGELRHQLGRDGPVGCDCGGGHRWEGDSRTLRLVKRRNAPADFTYTVEVPGEVSLPEVALKLRLTRGAIEPWMFRGDARRAALAAELGPASEVIARNRRPGDRLLPLGGSRSRRLKELLIDRRVPRHERDRLPLLVIDGEIAWVPGLTIGERFRLDPDAAEAWIVEIEPLGSESLPSAHG